MKTNGAMPSLGASTVRTAHRDVTERLRDAIVSGVLPAGTRLVQSDLATSLAVSVTPVREALRELESQGLVDFDPFRGATVHEVSLAELEEVYELRRALIPVAAAQRVRTITDAEIDEADAVVARMTLRVSDTRWVEDNRLLHRLLEGTSESHLGVIMRRLSNVSALYVGISVTTDPARRKRARDDHRALVKAYRRRNAGEITAISLRHINDTAATAAAALTDP